MIDAYAGGATDEIGAIVPGGAASGILPPAAFDAPLPDNRTTHSTQPRIETVDDVFTAEECELVIALGRPGRAVRASLRMIGVVAIFLVRTPLTRKTRMLVITKRSMCSRTARIVRCSSLMIQRSSSERSAERARPRQLKRCAQPMWCWLWARA